MFIITIHKQHITKIAVNIYINNMLRAIINRRLICSAFFPFNSSSDDDSNGKLTKLFRRKEAFINKYEGYFFDE